MPDTGKGQPSCRKTSSSALAALTGGLPEAVKAKELYAKIYESLPEIQRIHGGEFFATVSVISKPEVRKELAAVLRRMGDLHNDLFDLFDKGGLSK